MAAEVGVAYVRILPSMRGFSGQMRKGMAGTTGAATDTGKKAGRGFVGGFGGSLKGAAGSMVAIMGFQKLASFMGDTITAASDLGESVNAVNVVFGDAADGVLKLGRNAAEAVGMSQTEFQGLAVQFSAFAENIAGDGGNVVDTIDDLTGRAADFASVMNVDVAEAAQLFQSGLAGESEPLRRYGIDVSAAATETFAYANGIAEAGAELSEAEKVQARYGLIMEQTAKTQGDFANTSDSLANRQRILGAQWDDLKARLGQALVPVAEQALNILGKFLPHIENLLDGGGQLSGTFGGLGRAFGMVKDAIAPMIPIFRDIGSQVIAVLGPGLRKIGNVIVNQLIPAWADFITATQPLRAFVVEFLGKILVKALKVVMTVFEGALDFISGALKVFTGLFTGDWEKTWEGVKQIGSAVWDTVRKLFRIWFDKLGQKAAEALAWLKGKFRDGWDRIKQVVRDKADDILQWFRDLPGNIKDAIGDLGSLLYDAGRSVLQGLKDGMASMVDNVTQPVQDAVSKVKSYWPFSPAKTGPLRKDPPESWGVNVMSGVAAGLRKGAGTLGPASAVGAGSALPASSVPSTAARAAGATVVLNANGDRHLLAWLREMVRSQGGDVQVVLGA